MRKSRRPLRTGLVRERTPAAQLAAVRRTMSKQLQQIDYDLQILRDDLITLMGQLSDARQREISWIETAHARVEYADPNVTNEVRESTRHLASALCVLYFVVMTESFFPVTYRDSIGLQRNLWEECHAYGWLWLSELDRLRAYRHVRHSFAHYSDGTHARQHKSSFDRVSQSSNPLPAIGSDGTRISVESGASILMANEVHGIIQNFLSRMLSSPEFGPKPVQ